LRSEDPLFAFEELAFGSLGGVRIGGYAIRWNGDEARPLVVHGHGYGGGDFEPRWGWARAGMNVVGVEVRGYGRSRAALPGLPSPHGYVLTGIGSPEEYVLRGAVCDYARAVEVGKGILGPLVSRTVLHGASLAGGLAVMAEAVWGWAIFSSRRWRGSGWRRGGGAWAGGGRGGG